MFRKYFVYLLCNQSGKPTKTITMKRNYRQNRYPNGYQEKIGYWLYKVNKAVEANEVEALEYANKRLVYFLQRQEEWKEANAQVA